MLHFIVDGYNLINKIPRIENTPLKERRDFLLSLLQGFKGTLSPRNKITVIFDGSSKISFKTGPSGSLAVLFSKNEDADSLIKRIIEQAKSPKSFVVVTDDRDIISYTRSRGAKGESTQAFLSRISKKTARPKREDNFKLDPAQALKVNEELKGIWKEKYL
ncbi:MAG: NYN domain-containing protein [Candidatus Omnitrophica bacterium]|nr:NYN domain-containing protein [Candidatus Omnitrophota bacterium]